MGTPEGEENLLGNIKSLVNLNIYKALYLHGRFEVIRIIFYCNAVANLLAILINFEVYFVSVQLEALVCISEAF